MWAGSDPPPEGRAVSSVGALSALSVATPRGPGNRSRRRALRQADSTTPRRWRHRHGGFANRRAVVTETACAAGWCVGCPGADVHRTRRIPRDVRRSWQLVAECLHLVTRSNTALGGHVPPCHGRQGVATRDVAPRVATPVEQVSANSTCPDDRGCGSGACGRWSPNAGPKGMRGRQRWDPQRCHPRVRIPRRPRKAMAGALNPYGARLEEHVLWSPRQRDGRQRLAW